MPLLETLPVDERTAQWPLWSTTARLVVTNPDQLGAAEALVEQVCDDVERACSRFRPDAEIAALARAAGRHVAVSSTLAALLGAALDAARRTDGDVELGNGWVRVPPGAELDLGATAKAWAADRAAALVAGELDGVGVLVALGGDIATAGPGPGPRGWQVLVQDGPDQPADTVTLPAGTAIATSSTLSRRWVRDRRVLHHIVDPPTGIPAEPSSGRRRWRRPPASRPTR